MFMKKNNNDPFDFNKAINWKKLEEPEIIKQLENACCSRHATLQSLLEWLPDVVTIRGGICHGVPGENTRHIAQLVANQRRGGACRQ